MSFQFENQQFGAIEKMSDGLRTYFGRVYNYMAGGLALSGLTAYLAAHDPFIHWFYHVSPNGAVGYSLIGWLAILAPIALIFMISSSLSRLNTGRAQGLFWLFSALMGISLSNIFLFYQGADIFQAFLITGASFAGLSLYGYTTHKSLAGLSSFLFMGLFGVIIASIVNIFVQSASFNYGLNILCVIIFVGLTAYDTQKLKYMYQDSDSDEMTQAKAISGALALYLDFINLFRLILYFVGNNRK